jgi:hypothetical protein
VRGKMKASEYYSDYEASDIEDLCGYTEKLQEVVEVIRDCHYEGQDFGARDALEALPWWKKEERNHSPKSKGIVASVAERVDIVTRLLTEQKISQLEGKILLGFKI